MRLRLSHALPALLLAGLCLLGAGRGARAEGSRDLFPSGAAGNRANLEWRVDKYGNRLYRRSLLQVYANAGEYILYGSSAVGVSGSDKNGNSGTGDIAIYDASQVSGAVGGETLSGNPVSSASAQSGRGKITSRTLELAGPQSADGTRNTGGYVPAVYAVPASGLYYVAIYGTAGPNANTDGTTAPLGDIALSSAQNFDGTQGPTVAAWDVTVRDSASSTQDLPGRVFASYLALNVGSNGRLLHSTIYAATTDGYQYRIGLNGLDPYGFIIYGNQIGFLDSDGTSPLYHDVLSTSGAANRDQLTAIQGGCSLAPPSYPLFFATPDPEALAAANVDTLPTTPMVSALGFSGTAGGNNSRLGTGGNFSFTANISAVYDIVLSRDNVNFDPTLATNRRLRGVVPAGGSTVHWDGNDNSGNPFPVGTGYGVRAIIHGGEYHFPLLDAENSLSGGPSLTMLNASNPLGDTHGFYDDRGYRTVGGSYVTSDGTAATVGQVISTTNGPPSPDYSDPINGYDTTGTQHKWGDGGGTGFGDKKGLDLWTYYPSQPQTTTLNVQAAPGPPQLLLVKRITAVNGVNQTGFNADSGTADNSSYWPTDKATYLRGALSVPNVKPGDELEYTIYFLDTNGAGTNFTLADVLPADTTFEAAAYTAASGIALASSTSSLPTAPTSFLTNAADSDAGQFYPPGTQAPAAANPGGSFAAPLPGASNLSGVVVVTLAPSPATLPSATGPGTPTGSYGFLRFRVRVQ